jgi:hypothetical protein
MVACVRRMKESVGTCLDIYISTTNTKEGQGRSNLSISENTHGSTQKVLGECVFIDVCVQWPPERAFLESTLSERRQNLLLKLLQLRHIKSFIPADID